MAPTGEGAKVWLPRYAAMKRVLLWGGLIGVFFVVPAASEARPLAHFFGQIDLPQKTVEVTIEDVERRSAKIKFLPVAENLYQLFVEMDDIITPFFDISTHVASSWEVKRNPMGKVVALLVKLQSQYTLVNQKPVSELSGQLMIRGHKIVLNSLAGGTFYAGGEMDMTSPYRLKGETKFSAIPLKSVLPFFSGQPDIEADGDVAGALQIKGTPDAIFIEGELFSSAGSVEAWSFRSIDLRVAGQYPILFIQDSVINQTDGMLFKVTGPFDISRQDNWQKQAPALTMSPVVEGDAQTSDWMLKRIDSGKKSGSTELKYRLQQKKDVNTLSDQDADMIEIQRKMKF